MRRIRIARKSIVEIALMAGVVAMAAAARNAQAGQISGALSFNGNVEAFLAASGLGTHASDWTSAKSVVFYVTFISFGPTGSFESLDKLPLGREVGMDPEPIGINPPVVPNASFDGPLWSVGGYSFTLSTLSEPL